MALPILPVLIAHAFIFAFCSAAHYTHWLVFLRDTVVFLASPLLHFMRGPPVVHLVGQRPNMFQQGGHHIVAPCSLLLSLPLSSLTS